jgi:predicted lipid carrier protein YhbT
MPLRSRGILRGAPAAGARKVLRILLLNTEFQDSFNAYFKISCRDVRVEWVITPNDDNAYPNMRTPT